MTDELNKEDAAQTIARLSAEVDRLKKSNGKLKDILYTAKENCSLRTCLKCSHLHMTGHVCYQCGHDPSDI